MSSIDHMPRLWGIIPAAGQGSRFAHTMPKQHHELHGATVFYHTVRRLLEALPIKHLYIARSQNDTEWFRTLSFFPEHLSTAMTFLEGGAQRADSVMAALQQLLGQANKDDWVLVHDAARPCVRSEDLKRLWQHVVYSDEGAILAVPVRDSLKRGSLEPNASQLSQVIASVDRSQLWQAQTPQIFKFGQLYCALEAALQSGVEITDEASAMALQGFTVQLVQGRYDNIKITYPEDLQLAEYILCAQLEDKHA